MKWRIKYMVDPGDGIVTQETIEHPSDLIMDVCSDVWNGETSPGNIEGRWIFGVEAQPGEDDE